MDKFIFQAINGLSHKWWPLDWLGVFFAEYLGYIMIVLAVFIFLKEKNWRRRIYFFCLAWLSVILARGIITEIIRFFYHRSRPFLDLQIQPLINHDVTGSFPSGHATIYFALALAIFYFIQQTASSPDSAGHFHNNQDSKLGWWCLGMALLICLGRVFAGVHWPSDVFIGALIGLGSAWLVKKLLPEPK